MRRLRWPVACTTAVNRPQPLRQPLESVAPRSTASSAATSKAKLLNRLGLPVVVASIPRCQLRVADAIARRDDQRYVGQWKEPLHDTDHRGMFGMRRNGSPA